MDLSKAVKITLTELTVQLGELMPKYIKAQVEYANFMNELESKRAWWHRQEENIGLKNAEMREAHLYSFLEQEGMIEKKMEIGNNFYRLKSEKEFLIELSKNLRILEVK
jgi:DNA-binding transcriptional ArsR family regulator